MTDCQHAPGEYCARALLSSSMRSEQVVRSLVRELGLTQDQALRAIHDARLRRAAGN